MFQAGTPVLALIDECIGLQNGDAWTHLIDRLRPVFARAVYRVASERGTPNAAEIDDVIQDVFLKLGSPGGDILSRVPRDTEQAAITYLKVVAINAARDHFKARSAMKRGRDVLVGTGVEIETLAAAVDAAVPIERTVLIAQVDSVLAGVEPRERAIFWLYYRQGFTAKEIAAIPSLSLSPKGVESLIHRLTGRVRRALRPPDDTKEKKGDSQPEAFY